MPSASWGRRSLAKVASLVLAAAALAGAAAVSHDTRSTVHHHGVAVADPLGTADGWMGSLRAGERVVYPLDPGLVDGLTEYKPPIEVPNLPDDGATPGETLRAALILARYGATRDDVRAAAVEAAVLHLLRGGEWETGGEIGGDRIRRTGRGGSVLSEAHRLLEWSTPYSAPFELRTHQEVAGPGEPVAIQARVQAGAQGLPSVPVTFRYGTQTRTATTDEAGVAAATVPSDETVPTFEATARVPAQTLSVLEPENRTASALLVSGRSDLLRSTHAMVYRRPQTVSVELAGKPPYRTGETVTGTWTVEGGGGTRSFRSGIYRSDPTCELGAAVAQRTGTVTGQQGPSLRFPEARIDTPGWYALDVAVDTNERSASARACQPFPVKSPTTVTIGSGGQVVVGGLLAVDVTVTGIPPGEELEVESRVYGPFTVRDNVGCDSDRLRGLVTHPVSADGTTPSPGLTVAKSGFYVWRVSLPEGEWSLPSRSRCTTADPVQVRNR